MTYSPFFRQTCNILKTNYAFAIHSQEIFTQFAQIIVGDLFDWEIVNIILLALADHHLRIITFIFKYINSISILHLVVTKCLTSLHLASCKVASLTLKIIIHFAIIKNVLDFDVFARLGNEVAIESKSISIVNNNSVNNEIMAAGRRDVNGPHFFRGMGLLEHALDSKRYEIPTLANPQNVHPHLNILSMHPFEIIKHYQRPLEHCYCLVLIIISKQLYRYELIFIHLLLDGKLELMILFNN